MRAIDRKLQIIQRSQLTTFVLLTNTTRIQRNAGQQYC